MNHSRPARPAAHRDEGRTDYREMTKALLDRIDSSFAHRVIYEITRNIYKNQDKYEK